MNPVGSDPPDRGNRLFGEAVTIGEPLQIQSRQDMHEQVEVSLERIARDRLLDVEETAQAQARSILEEAQAKAGEILERANAQAKAMIETAQEQEISIRDEAQESGFRSGFAEGYADATDHAAQDTAKLLENARLILDAAYQAEKNVLREVETHALELIRYVVRKILRRELSDAPDILSDMVRNAVASLYLTGTVRVVLHPDVLQSIRQFSEKTADPLDTLRRFEWIADPALPPGQIYITGQGGSFDLTPEAQADNLLNALKGDLRLPVLTSLPSPLTGEGQGGGDENDGRNTIER